MRVLMWMLMGSFLFGFGSAVSAPRGYRSFRDRIARGLNQVLSPFEAVLIKLRVGPDSLNYSGLFLAAASGILFAAGALVFGGMLLLLSGLCDILDGRIARRTGRVSAFGAFLDSTLDRFGESLTFLGLLIFLQERGVSGFWPALALAGALLVSYARARGESVGVLCDTGLMQRGERIFLICTACFCAPLLSRITGIAEVRIIEGALAVIGIGAWLTAALRTLKIGARLRRK
jgi:CDP-diacylglycerol--glycerol-3-phosphate 3-phosphatidyltransferase